MEKSRRSVDVYLRGLPDADRTVIATIDRVLVESMTGASRRLWTGTFWGGTQQEIIGYGDIRQPRPKGDAVDWFVIGLARQTRHYSLYVNAVENGRYLGEAYATRLGKVKAGAASLTFRRLDDLDLGVLAELAGRARELVREDQSRGGT